MHGMHEICAQLGVQSLIQTVNQWVNDSVMLSSTTWNELIQTCAIIQRSELVEVASHQSVRNCSGIIVGQIPTRTIAPHTIR
jgi:hypothetical protein